MNVFLKYSKNSTEIVAVIILNSVNLLGVNQNLHTCTVLDVSGLEIGVFLVNLSDPHFSSGIQNE